MTAREWLSAQPDTMPLNDGGMTWDAYTLLENIKVDFEVMVRATPDGLAIVHRIGPDGYAESTPWLKEEPRA